MKQKRVLNSLTALRFVAAYLVFNCHFLNPERWMSAAPPAWLFRFIAAGGSGVEMFFVLSGFILSYSYDELVLQFEPLKRFFIARFARIYPVYFLGFLWFAPFILTHRFATDGSIRAAILKSVSSGIDTLFLTQSWFHPRFAIAWNGPGWTLSVEAIFYLCFPWINVWIRRLSPRRLAVLTVVNGLVLFLLPLTMSHLFHNSALIQGPAAAASAQPSPYVRLRHVSRTHL